MAKNDPNLLYSANCVLSYRICKQFYGNLHYVWCSTIFGSVEVDDPLIKNPRSSAPYERYTNLKSDSGRSGDHHSNIISDQRAGIKRGAMEHFKVKDITTAERNEILEIVDAAEISDFEPLMYVMPYQKVKSLAKKVTVSKRAHPLSDEWLIPKLPRDYFEIIRF